MDATSNKLNFNPIDWKYPAVRLASGLAINTTTLIVTGIARGSVVTDVLFRNLDGTNARNFDIIIGASGATVENNRCQISIPANSGNNGIIPLASLAALASPLFDNNLQGDRVMILNNTLSIWVVNKAALTSDVYITVKQRDF